MTSPGSCAAAPTCRATGQIGPVVVVNESSIGSNVRRVEAYTGSHAFRYLSDLRAELLGVARHLRVRPDAAAAAAGSLLARNRGLEKRLAAYEAQARSGAAAGLAEAAEAGRRGPAGGGLACRAPAR